MPPPNRLPLHFVILGLLVFVIGSRAEEAAKKSVSEGSGLFSVKVTGTGRPMILIPGLSCSGDVWDETVQHFKSRYECHVMTLAGFAGQPAIGEPMLEQIRDGLGRYIREKGLKHPILVGHSLGAFMAFWLGATFPDQVGPIVAVDGMPYFPALVDAKATPKMTRSMAESLREMYGAQSPSQFEFSLRVTLRGMVTDVEDFEQVAQSSSKSDPKAVAQALYELMTIDLRPQVAAIQVPVLVLGATAIGGDAKQRQQMEGNYRAQVQTIPQHKILFAPQSRHFIQLDEPEFLFVEMENFLGSVSDL